MRSSLSGPTVRMAAATTLRTEMQPAGTFQVEDCNFLQKACHSAIGGSAFGGKHYSGDMLHSAFTLIEILLVVVVMGIAAAIAMPSFVRSIQGQRLSTAARTLATVARYARSMAVLKQSDLSLTFNLASGQVDLASPNASMPNFARTVHGVRLQTVTIEGADPVTEGVCSVPFMRNGVCIPFAVIIMDPNGNYVVLQVDALGSVKSKVFGAQ